MGNGEETPEEDDIREPDILSADPNERKLARRMRIQRRLEAAKKQQGEEDEDEIEDVEKTLLEEQVEISAEQLEKLLLEGKELVTNVRVANDAREVQRRETEVSAREERLKKLEEEAAKSLEKFEEINAKWEQTANSNDPLDMHQEMEEQKVKCLQLIAQKNVMIEELRKELMVADERFNKDQRKQKEDLALVVERIDNQVNLMRRAYRQELKLIEQAIGQERKQQLDAANRKWEQMYKEREKEEVSHMNKKFEQVSEFEDEMHRINIECQEKMRETKIKLETDIQVLQQELEQVKALCLLNSEKLDYNFQVLKKRDEENLVIKAQQKRRLNKLQDVVNTLKKKIAEVQHHTDSEQARLTAEVIRLHSNIIDIEKKADHFTVINDTRYRHVWGMNREEAQKLLNKILTTDRLIHEQQLGVEWKRPEQSVLETEDLESYRSAMKVVQELFSHKGIPGQENNSMMSKEYLEHESEVAVKKYMAEQRLLHHLLTRIADNTGFLLEERLKMLLVPYTKPQQMLIKIDNVFSALGIKSESDMIMLKRFFHPYIQCNMCDKLEAKFNMMYNVPEVELRTTVLFKADGQDDSQSNVSNESIGSIEEKEQMLSILAEDVERRKSMVNSVASSVATTGLVSGSSLRFSEKQQHQEVTKKGISSDDMSIKMPSGSLKRFKAKCTPDHTLTIDPIYVLKGVRDFMIHFTQDKEGGLVNMASRLAKKRSTVSRLMKTEDVSMFWVRFNEIFSKDREKLWDGLLMGLQKYHAILEDRHKLNTETEQLRSQNAELRRLLQTYMEPEQPAQGSGPPGNRQPYRTGGRPRPRNPNPKCNCNFKCYCKC